ncbi:hypothetical protein FZEAL_2583 [Fusarium zealandicum]|uniref:Xylanolytic transcriptional activator regulatory domain-containing protein n=1 Tax=Fusarium zealandicum TaxID=1053134 RepID=A0A8H4UR66_9HYPO|nr:hypothetical protein FZEAL_2583 [Fusarium zealandicum]
MRLCHDTVTSTENRFEGSDMNGISLPQGLDSTRVLDLLIPSSLGLRLGQKPSPHQCGRERPHCSNCTRLGLECEWLGQGKKPNQTIWLSHAVTRLGDRLEKLESAVSGLQSIQDPESTPIQDPLSPGSGANTHYGRRCSISNQRYYGSTSFVSLMQDMAAVILDNRRDAEDDTTSTAAVARDEILQLAEPHDSCRRVSDGSVLTGPPLVIVEAMIDPYFDMVNPHMPLWTKEGFRRLMNSAGQSSSASDKRAYDVCANNLVLLTLQAKSLQSRAAPDLPCTEAPAASSIDIDLVRSFIVNAKRALENVELLLLNPSLLTLQAFLSLCLVAQTSLSEDVTSLLFSFAVHVAKSIGLRHWSSSTRREALSPSDSDERRNAMYCIICLSRAVAWSSGLNSSLPGISVFERELASSSADETSNQLAARVTLLRLEEQVYTDLYSYDAMRQGGDAIGKMALSRARKLQFWAAEHIDDINDDQGCSEVLDNSQYELAVRFYSIQALAMWPMVETAEGSPSMLDVARSSIRLFQRLWTTASEGGHCLDLALLVASYPPVPFFELSKYVLCNQPAAEDDLELLQSFFNMVHAFSEWAEETSYIKKLSKFGDIMLRLATSSQDTGSSIPGEIPSLPTVAGQTYMCSLEQYSSYVAPAAQTYGGDSAASSSSHTNSTPLSGYVQPMPPIPDMEPVSVPEAFTSTFTSPLVTFGRAFDGEISPLYDLDGWIIEPGSADNMRSLKPNPSTGFMLRENNPFAFDRIDLG